MLPAGITFDEEGDLTDDVFEPKPTRGGRPSNDQAQASQPSKALGMRRLVQGNVRPGRNKKGPTYWSHMTHIRFLYLLPRHYINI